MPAPTVQPPAFGHNDARRRGATSGLTMIYMTTTNEALRALAEQALLDRLSGWAVVGTCGEGWHQRVRLAPKLAPTAAELAWQAVCVRPERPESQPVPVHPAVVRLSQQAKAARKS